MRGTRALVAVGLMLAAAGPGCDESCDDLANEWQRTAASDVAECSTSSECTLVAPEYDMNSGCSIDHCGAIPARRESGTSQRLVALSREWLRKRCFGNVVCESGCGGAFSVEPDCSEGRCTKKTTWLDAGAGGAGVDAQPDQTAPPDAPAD